MGKDTKIEWCDSTWNPVSGCYHGCPYCYARGIAARFAGADELMESSRDVEVLDTQLKKTCENGSVIKAAYPYGFKPTFHRYRIPELKKLKGETVFVCSMADLFGEWVPDKWIDEVFDACLDNPGHRYLFLTKNPARYVSLAKEDRLPTGDEFWYGSTTTEPDAPAFWSNNHHTFVSIEPILKPFETNMGVNSIIEKSEWFIFGAETGNRKDKVVPEEWWIQDAVRLLDERGVPVFMKDSLKGIWQGELITGFPWRR